MHQCEERDLIAVNNGVFFYGNHDTDLKIDGKAFSFKAKSLHPFDPTLVFVSKSRVNYVAAAVKPVITHPKDGTVWDVESWVEEFYFTEGDDDFNLKNDGMAALIWETIGAIVRPHVRWGKTAWFYSESGNNGKGTLCALMRNIVGSGSHTSIPLSDFGKEFALEPLVRASAVIVDENDVGTFIDKAANLKAIVTNDVIQINRKYRMPIAFQFWGFMVQCLNEFPLVKDKSESFYRRQLFVPFTKCFTGAERKYIKDDYLERRDVLEHVLWYALHVAGSRTPGEYYELAEPLATKVALSEYKETNDPVRAFWMEFRDKFVWDLVPFTFLYDLYKAWFVEVSPSGSPISAQRFIKDLLPIIQTDDGWHCPDKSKAVRPGLRMKDPELLIVRHELKNWFNPLEKNNKNPDQARLASPSIAANYRGIQRMTQAMVNATTATAVPSSADADN
nr:phage/plasmid primase, P4 family [Leucobacter exalbidus]